ncbi:MAG: hypothetical protein BA864_06645 [Desulfuromonadales bacterium C00003093]|nr:MAG: hypothetical protein BA864_06645 [Desulfuromonadales bacterium C00003093]
MNVPQKKSFRFSIHLSQQQFLRHYQGSASAVQVISECGRRLRFPASRLRSFLTHSGISGRFQLTVDADNRFLDLKKIS